MSDHPERDDLPVEGAGSTGAVPGAPRQDPPVPPPGAPAEPSRPTSAAARGDTAPEAATTAAVTAVPARPEDAGAPPPGRSAPGLVAQAGTPPTGAVSSGTLPAGVPAAGTAPASAPPASAPPASAAAPGSASARSTASGTGGTANGGAGASGSGAGRGAGASNATASGAGKRPPAPPGRGGGELAPRRASPLGGIALVLVILEGAALALFWAHPRVPPDLADAIDNARDTATGAATKADAAAAAVAGLAAKVNGQAPTQGDAVQALAARLDALERRVATRPAGAAATEANGAAATQGNVAAATGSNGAAAPPSAASAPPAPPPNPALDALPGQLAALSNRLDDGLAALRGEIESVRDEGRTASAAATSAERADVASLREELTHRDTELDARLAVLGNRVAGYGAESRQVASLAGKAERLARLEAAGVALEDGRPTGPIAGAPPALARFADTAPPTEAALALAFPAAARATLKASEPDTHHAGFFRRLWIRAEAAVTVSDGNRVLVGDPASGIIGTARSRLAVGDLRGAVAALGALRGGAAAAIAPWRDQAQSLLAARDALSGLESAT